MGPTAIFAGYCSLPNAFLTENELVAVLEKALKAEEAGLDSSPGKILEASMQASICRAIWEKNLKNKRRKEHHQHCSHI